MRRLAGVITLLLLLLLALPAYADDGALGREGDTVYPLSESDVRMAAEEVHLKVGVERTQVDVTFTFVNDGPAREILMGFPVGTPEGEHQGDPELHDFSAWVDGRRMAVKQEPQTAKGPAVVNSLGDALRYPAWITWSVPFAAGQTRTVRNTYWGANTHWSNGEVAAGYILRTGATWKGAIGSAVITAELDGILPGQLFGISPTTFRWEGEKLVWRFQDLEPNQDIRLRFTTRPLLSLKVTSDVNAAIFAAYARGGPEGLKLLREARRKLPTEGTPPDTLDLALAESEYRYGDRQAALQTVKAALAAGQTAFHLVPYLAWKEGLRKPAELLATEPGTLGLSSLLRDAAGTEGRPPDAPQVSLGTVEPDLSRADLSLTFSDPDRDLDRWSIKVWGTPDEGSKPLATLFSTDSPFYMNEEAYTPSLQVWNNSGGAEFWYRATAADGRGHTVDTGLVELPLREAAAAPDTATAPEAPQPTAPSPAARTEVRLPGWSFGMLMLLSLGLLASLYHRDANSGGD
jgi:hypothetical protein